LNCEQLKHIMNVLIGDVFDPAMMWVAPVEQQTTPIKDMEWNLSTDGQSGRLGDEPPDDVFPGLKVAVKSSRKVELWQRGKITSVDHIAGPTFHRNDKVLVDVFLVDVGKTLKDVEVSSRIRSLPDHYNEIEDSAFLVRLEGLMPICKSVDYSKKGKFRNIISRTWNEHCLNMVFALIKVSDGQTFYDSDVDLGVCVKGGYPIRVGKIVMELPLMIKNSHQQRLKPYTSYITTGMWLQGERRLLNLNECLVENNFATKMKTEEIFSTGESLQPVLTLLDEKQGLNPYFSSANTSSSVEGAKGDRKGYRVRDFWDCDDEYCEEDSPDDMVDTSNRQQEMEGRIKRLLDDIELRKNDLEDDTHPLNSDDELSKLTDHSSGDHLDEDSFVVDSDGERYYSCTEELD